MQKICFLTSAILLLTLLTGISSAQNGQIMVKKAGKVKLLKTEDFKYADVGNPSIAGKINVSDGGFDITAGGADIWGVKDEFSPLPERLMYQTEDLILLQAELIYGE
jgi:hypothetical protein